MRTRLTATFACACVSLGVGHAQFGRGPAEWSTSGGDAHRSSSAATDPKISKESLSKPGFALFWKLKLNNESRQGNALYAPTLMDRHIGIHGFRSFGFVSGSGDNVWAVDTDLGRIDWQKSFGKRTLAGASTTCPGGLTTGTARSIGTSFPAAMPGGRGGGGRGTPAKSGVGEPGEGGITIAELEARAAAMNAAAARGGRAPAGFGGGGRGQRVAVVVNSLSSDGLFHTNYVSNGDEPNPPVRFLPANANAQGLIVVDNVAYVATVDGCGGVPNGVWALDIASKAVTSWSGDVAGTAGAAFGGDGTVYVSTTGGDLVALEPKTLKVKETYRAGQELTSTPVVFQMKAKTWVAVTAKDGRIHLVDGAAMAGAAVKSAPNATGSDFAPGALATWQDAAGTRWILAPSAGAIVAWKVVEHDGAAALEPGWVLRDLVSPLTPLVINDVVFAVSGGEAHGKTAVLYALDAATGKELWNSGKTITSFIHGGGISAGAGQVYLGTHDGTLYSFGFPIEH